MWGLGKLGKVGNRATAVVVPGTISASNASFLLSGQDAELRATRTLTADAGAFAFIGKDAILIPPATDLLLLADGASRLLLVNGVDRLAL